jgi:signal transduction histidine kinase/DNA-binding response OmpR family regulator
MAVKRPLPLVLVADDEVNTTIMLQRIFEREGFQVHIENDGVSALRAAQELLPDLILLDIRMPGMNGFDVLRALRENSTTSAIPTILVTANAREPADVALGLNLGADDYLYKPFAPQELVARAESKMKARQLEDALQRRTEELTALLKLSENLIQHVERADLLGKIAEMISALLPADVAVVLQVDGNGQVIAQDQRLSAEIAEDYRVDTSDFAPRFMRADRAIIWPTDKILIDGFTGGMAAPLRHGGVTFGVLLIASLSQTYDESQFRLFQGASRQAGLALRNAILHEIQVNYALHLEDMVAERTAELQSAQQMLIRSEKLASIGHLAANIAHEINNPLQPITVTLDDLVETVASNHPVDIRGIEIIQESVERIRRIVSQLLEFTGKRTTGPDLQVLDLTSVVERIVDLNRKFFEKEGMTIETRLEQLPPIYGSKDQLEQVFMNLSLNAQAAMKRKGKLIIEGTSEGKDVVIRFCDNGIGIPADQIDRIFDPFFSTKPNGTGLGLFVSYGIIQGHHGVIEVESVVGQGTTFTLRLPICETAPET